MTRKPKLMERLDQAAFRLLDRTFPLNATPAVEGAPALAEPDVGAQVRTFEAVVKYYGPRTKLGKDDEKESEFGSLRDRLHGKQHNRKVTRRRTSAEVDAEDAARLNGSASD